MMKHMIVLAIAVAFNAFAEEDAATTTQATSAAAAEARVLGKVDLRPSYTGKAPSDSAWDYHSENFGELGYQFDANSVLSYRQEFNTNIFDSRSNVNGGVDPIAKSGFVRGQVKNLYTNGDVNLGYEARAYLPTDAAKRDAGMVTAVRNYGIMTYKLSDSASLLLFEVPIVHMYDRPGYNNAANPSFENRLQIHGFFTLAEGLTFELPITLFSTRYRNFQANAKNNDAWDHNLSIYPELLYQIDKTYTVGIAYYSDYLMTSDLSKFTIGDGLEKGTYQLVFIANL